MEKHWGQNVAARGGFGGNSPDALLLNLFITGAAEEEDKALAQPHGSDGDKSRRIELTPTRQADRGVSDLPPEHQRP